MSDDTPLDHLLTTAMPLPLPAPPTPPVDDPAVAAGMRVAHAWATQDRLDPHRPTLGQLVADEVAAVERRHTTRRHGDAEGQVIRQRIADLVTQREQLADARIAVALRRVDEGNLAAAAAELTWAASLRDQAAALRVMLG